MLISELKKEIEKYDKKELKNIITELYKRVPKAKKEEYCIDEFIKDASKKNENKNKEMSFEELQKEISLFLVYVDNGYYIVPNKIISKKERSSWRFKVKKYYKKLNEIAPNSEDGEKATELLIEIFKRLSVGSNTLLFINWETFKALGVPQNDYYNVIMKRILINGYTEENLKQCINVLDVPKDPYELSYYMYHTYISNLKNVAMEEISIKLMKEKVIRITQINLKDKTSTEKHYLRETLNNYVKCILEIFIIMGEINTGIKYFLQNYKEKDEEVKEYILLEKLKDMDLIDEWVQEYESKIGKIKFRRYLVEDYEEFKKRVRR